MKLVIVVLASVVAVSSASASEHIYKHHHFHNPHNAMNMTQGPAYAPSYGTTAYYPRGSDEYSSVPGGTNLSGTGSSQFGGGPGDSAGGGGGGGP